MSLIVWWLTAGLLTRHGFCVGSAVALAWDAIKRAPQAVLSPSKAGGFPSMSMPRGRMWTMG
ncbi:hypothetical protein WJ59_12130 [Burkholderia gladioli]|nr:hypothetical protein LA03_27705 [Burkholderia gladioli]KVM68742.1 hypothetical protein WJ59_12130 [Burkholderia gladioli]